MKTIQVTQSASEQLAPDSTVIEIRLHSENESYAAAAKQLHKTTAETLDRLCACGLGDEVKRQSESVSSVQYNGKTKFEGNGSLRITLAVSDARIEKCIEALEQSGAPWRQSFVLTDTSYRNGLIAKAVQAAHDAAQTIAAAANVHLGTLANVEYAASFGGGARMLCAMGRSGDNATPDTIEVTEAVTCSWEIID